MSKRERGAARGGSESCIPWNRAVAGAPPSLPQAPPAAPRARPSTTPRSAAPVPPGWGSCGRHGDNDPDPLPASSGGRCPAEPPPRGFPAPGGQQPLAIRRHSPALGAPLPPASRLRAGGCRRPPAPWKSGAGRPPLSAAPPPPPARLGSARLSPGGLSSPPQALPECGERCSAALRPPRHPPAASPGALPAPLRASPAPGALPARLRARPRTAPAPSLTLPQPRRRQRGSAPPPHLTCAPRPRTAQRSRQRQRLRTGTKLRSARSGLTARGCGPGPGTAVPGRAPHLPRSCPTLAGLLGSVPGPDPPRAPCPRFWWPERHLSSPFLSFPGSGRGCQPGFLPRPGHLQQRQSWACAAAPPEPLTPTAPAKRCQDPTTVAMASWDRAVTTKCWEPPWG